MLAGFGEQAPEAISPHSPEASSYQMPRRDVCSQPGGLCCPRQPTASEPTSPSEPRPLPSPALCPFLFS